MRQYLRTVGFDASDSAWNNESVTRSLYLSLSSYFLVASYREQRRRGTIKTSGCVWDSCKPRVSVIRYHNYKASSITEPKCCNSWGISRRLPPPPLPRAGGSAFSTCLSTPQPICFKLNLKRRDEWETVALAGWYTIPTNKKSVHVIHLLNDTHPLD